MPQAGRNKLKGHAGCPRVSPVAPQKKSDKTEGGQHTRHRTGRERHTWAQLRSVGRGDTAQRVVKGLVRIKRSRSRRGAEPSSTRREKGSGEGARPRIIRTRSVQVGHRLDASIGCSESEHGQAWALLERTGAALDAERRLNTSGQEAIKRRRQNGVGVTGFRERGAVVVRLRPNRGGEVEVPEHRRGAQACPGDAERSLDALFRG
ncbi:hypothetical protein BDV93DRAFT_561612 [Ceratobasidium sp. AG-I]|nr:hypothetical protein BDV93DRAFT_561612 [Ceratobasidium sp. AG-I]